MRDYFQYLDEVLGLQKVLISNQTQNETSSPFLDQNSKSTSMGTGDSRVIHFFTETGDFFPADKLYCELIFLNIVTQTKESIFRPDAKELFGKMRAAMKLKNLQVLTLDCRVEDRSFLISEVEKICESKIVVVFSSFPKDIGELTYKGSGQWIETYSPAYLLEDPGAKKVVWNDLQKVMRQLS
jgi:hypothetical protein